MTNRVDITQHSPCELINIFMNDEHFYEMFQMAVRRGDWSLLVDVVKMEYYYTVEQLAELKEQFDHETYEQAIGA